MSTEGLLDLTFHTLNQMGVVFTGVEIKENIPCYYVNIYEDSLIYTLDNTLKYVYQILWILSYGKVTEEKSQRLKINLNYQVVGDEKEG